MTDSRQIDHRRQRVKLRKFVRWVFPSLDDPGLDVDQLRRRIMISVLTIVAAPTLLWFSSLEWQAGEAQMSMVLAIGAALLAVMFILVRRGFVELLLARVTIAYVAVLAMLPILLGRGPEQMFFMLMFPAATVFTFGMREGIAWSFGALIALLALLNPLFGFVSRSTIAAGDDFILAYLLILSFSLGYEILRVRAQTVADERNRKLDDERQRLVQIQSELRKSEARFKRYADLATDWLYELDADLNVVYISPSFEQSTGIAVSRVLNQPVSALLGHFLDCETLSHLETLEQCRSFRDFRFSIVQADGKRAHLIGRGDPITTGVDTFSGYVCASTDITQYEEIQEDLRDRDRTLHHVQKLDAIGHLTSGVAHDFNNLLTVIKGNLEFVKLSISGEENQESVDAIDSAVNQASDLTGKLLSFSKQQPLEKGVVDVGRELSDLMTLVRHSVGERVSVELVVSSGVKLCEIDKSQLHSAVLNMALNARDAMDHEGRLVITVKDQEIRDDLELDPGDYVRISMIDEGKGIPSEIIDKVVDPFFTTKAVGEGTGLGLSMVYGFVSQSGGKLVIESLPDVGTNITMILPVTQATPSDSVEEDRPAVMGSGRKALMVEDETNVQKIVGRMLRLMGYETTICGNAEEALDIIEDTAPELLVTDMMLGAGKNGMELADRVRARHPDTRILLMSGYPEEILEHRSEDDFSYKLLRKPFGFKDLSATLEELMQK